MKAAVSLNDFSDDVPYRDIPSRATGSPGAIEGVVITPLTPRSDGRGHLTALISEGDPLGPIVHVYQVHAAPGSIRAWVYHKRQHDRLHYVEGDFRLVLYDLRADSSTYGKLQVIDVGEKNQCQVAIPPFVVHALQNRGSTTASFVNAPTRAFDPANPDKSRLPKDHPGIPYRFE